MMGELFKALGPWGLAIAVMAYLLKVMVADKLSDIKRTLASLVDGQSDHSDRLVRLETVVSLNGCGSGDTCGVSQKHRNTA